MKNPSQKDNSERIITSMIIGAQKSGTTSLKNYLGQHPSIQVHPQKEFSYFFDAEEYNDGFKSALKKYFDDPMSNEKLVAKNAGLYVSEEGIKRLKIHNPDCKLIFMVRNPVERSYSSFLMEKNYGAIHESFESIEGILRKGDLNDWRYIFLIEMGIYYKHLQMVYNHFPKEQVKLVRFKDFRADAAAVCRDIFEWLEVATDFIPDTTVKYNVTHVNRSPSYGRFIIHMLRNQNPIKKLARNVIPSGMDYKVGEMLRNINKTKKLHGKIPEKMYDLLSEFYAPHNEKLSELTGMDFSSWDSVQ